MMPKVRCTKEPSRCSGSLASSTEPESALASAALTRPTPAAFCSLATFSPSPLRVVCLHASRQRVAGTRLPSGRPTPAHQRWLRFHSFFSPLSDRGAERLKEKAFLFTQLSPRE